MNPLTVNHDTLDDTIQNHDVLVIDLWASWCVPCQRFGPVFDAMAQSTPEVVFAKFQVDASAENQDRFESMGYTTVPTLMGFRGGTLITSTSGFLGKADLTAVLDSLRS